MGNEEKLIFDKTRNGHTRRPNKGFLHPQEASQKAYTTMDESFFHCLNKPSLILRSAFEISTIKLLYCFRCRINDQKGKWKIIIAPEKGSFEKIIQQWNYKFTHFSKENFKKRERSRSSCINSIYSSSFVIPFHYLFSKFICSDILYLHWMQKFLQSHWTNNGTMKNDKVEEKKTDDNAIIFLSTPLTSSEFPFFSRLQFGYMQKWLINYGCYKIDLCLFVNTAMFAFSRVYSLCKIDGKNVSETWQTSAEAKRENFPVGTKKVRALDTQTKLKINKVFDECTGESKKSPSTLSLVCFSDDPKNEKWM